MHSSEIENAVITSPPTVALVGNPNSGKTSLFNSLTGLNQKVGNFPGVTVDKKTGSWQLSTGQRVALLDFPGAYSLYPTSQDERIVAQTLLTPSSEGYPSAILYVADVNRLEKHLLLFTQLKDFGIPLGLVLTMTDEAELTVDVEYLSQQLGTPVVEVSSRTGHGLAELARITTQLLTQKTAAKPTVQYHLSATERKIAEAVQQRYPHLPAYRALLLAHHASWLPELSSEERRHLDAIGRTYDLRSLPAQVEETLARYRAFSPIVQRAVREQHTTDSLSARIDALITHRVAGPIIFFGIMLLVFQAIFAWASYPMDAIELLFGSLGEQVRNGLGAGWLSDLLVDGLLAGLGGILVFAPQIGILFFLISILEEVGYMARAAYMFDNIMQRFGMNGRSVVALISGHACAIPAIMSTRTIANWKERLITIFVTPFTGCSARIPVYTVLIGFAVPAQTVLGVFNLQGLVFMLLYLLGIAAALVSALAMRYLLHSREYSMLMLELPDYRLPVWRNVWLTVWEKVTTFVSEAGRVIIVISLLLWALSTFGWPGRMDAAEASARTQAVQLALDEVATDDMVAAQRLEASFAGQLGHFIEPVIRPLGYDWKIGIALLASFAAREVFVGTMATIYSIGSSDDEFSVRERLATERNPVTGELTYNRATAASLLLFYVFAMMCMSTLAVVRRETKSWKWPLLQFVVMTGMAYVTALLAYQWLS